MPSYLLPAYLITLLLSLSSALSQHYPARGPSGLRIHLPSCSPSSHSFLLSSFASLQRLAWSGLREARSTTNYSYDYFFTELDRPTAQQGYTHIHNIARGAETALFRVLVRCDDPQGTCARHSDRAQAYHVEYATGPDRVRDMVREIVLCPATMKRAVKASRKGGWDAEWCTRDPGWYDRGVLSLVLLHELAHFVGVVPGVDVMDSIGYGLRECIEGRERGVVNAQSWAFLAGYALREELLELGKCGGRGEIGRGRGKEKSVLERNLAKHPSVERQELRRLFGWLEPP